jgi:hypothetical protein
MNTIDQVLELMRSGILPESLWLRPECVEVWYPTGEVISLVLPITVDDRRHLAAVLAKIAVTCGWETNPRKAMRDIMHVPRDHDGPFYPASFG